MNSNEKMLIVLRSGRYSMNELGRMLGISSGRLCEIKNGNVNPLNVRWHTVERIAKYYTSEMEK